MTNITTDLGQFEIPRFPVRRFTVAEYHQMIAAGILRDGEKVELLRGLITQKMARNPPHDLVLSLTDEFLRALLPADWKARVQSAITTTDSEPEPDIAVVRGPLTRYASRHPHGNDVGLAVECADTSLERDRDEKGPIYAKAGLPYYWIINIVARTVEVYSLPTDTGFRQRRDFGIGESVPLILDGVQMGAIAVASLFAGLTEADSMREM